MKPALSLRHVSKQYPVFDSMRDRIREVFDPLRRKFHRPFWALRDVSIDIMPATTVGILGVNGSGKSTLLKIISSVLQPSEGEVEINGRVAALLELGAGFDRALTGRANAEFHCLLNGYSAAATRKLLPKIEDFAEVGDFFDQPMQTYSSGMFMRVAFATSIHVEPEILIIDEALSVGDARFQQKCFQKFREFQIAGKTILFVTHDRFMVPRICNHAILLDQGRLLMAGDPGEVTQRYSEILALSDKRIPQTSDNSPGLSSISVDGPAPDSPFGTSVIDTRADYCPRNPTYNNNERRYGVGGARIIDYAIVADGKKNPTSLPSGATVELWIRIAFFEDIEQPIIGFSVKSVDGLLVYSTNSHWLGSDLADRPAQSVGEYRFSFQALLGSGDWFLDLAIARTPDHMCDVRESAVHFYVFRDCPNAGLVYLDTKLLEQLPNATLAAE